MAGSAAPRLTSAHPTLKWSVILLPSQYLFSPYLLTYLLPPPHLSTLNSWQPGLTSSFPPSFLTSNIPPPPHPHTVNPCLPHSYDSLLILCYLTTKTPHIMYEYVGDNPHDIPSHQDSWYSLSSLGESVVSCMFSYSVTGSFRQAHLLYTVFTTILNIVWSVIPCVPGYNGQLR